MALNRAWAATPVVALLFSMATCTPVRKWEPPPDAERSDAGGDDGPRAGGGGGWGTGGSDGFGGGRPADAMTSAAETSSTAGASACGSQSCDARDVSEDLVATPADGPNASDQRLPGNLDSSVTDIPPAACKAGTHRCGSECVTDDNPDLCGQQCIKCPTAPDLRERALCVAETCRTECRVVCSESPASCANTSWDFESGSNDGLMVEQGGVTPVRANSGRYSVASRRWIPSPVVIGNGFVRMDVKLCTGTTNLLGRRVSMAVYIEGQEFDPAESGCYFYYVIEEGSNGAITSNGTTSIPVPSRDAWFPIQTRILEETKSRSLSLGCWIKPIAGATTWQGTVYFDDFRIE
jgi:hypothetical protein